MRVTGARSHLPFLEKRAVCRLVPWPALGLSLGPGRPHLCPEGTEEDAARPRSFRTALVRPAAQSWLWKQRPSNLRLVSSPASDAPSPAERPWIMELIFFFFSSWTPFFFPSFLPGRGSDGSIRALRLSGVQARLPGRAGERPQGGRGSAAHPGTNSCALRPELAPDGAAHSTKKAAQEPIDHLACKARRPRRSGLPNDARPPSGT